jgi:LysR family transcriptional regulator, mexEF-oprN operon transcriptional activator
LGDALLVRHGNSLMRTERGEALLDQARAALSSAANVLAPEPPFDAKSARGVIRISLADDVTLALAPPIMRMLRERAPGLDLRIRPIRLDLPERLVRGTIDVAVIPDVRALSLPMPGISAYVLKPLLNERFVVVSRDHRRLSLASYIESNHVLTVPAGDDDTGFIDILLARKRHKRRVALTVPSFHHAVRVVSETDLIATLPERSARIAAAGLAVHVITPPLEIPALPMLLAWHPRSTTSPRHRFIRTLVEEAARTKGVR